MRLLFLRHGRTTAPPSTFVGSRIDPGLDAHGREQATAAGRILQQRPLAAVICSPLRRARETAAHALPGITPRFDARLQELDWGDITGLTWTEVEQHHPAVAADWIRTGWPLPPNGEDPRTLWRRVAAALLDLHAENHDGDVLVVCHGGVIRAALGAARGLGLSDAWRVHTPHARLRVQHATPLATARWRAVLEAS